jgi:hypothetical protein
MAYPEYLRNRALELRTRNLLSLDEIAQRLALPKTTVYYWIRHIPLGRPRRASAGARKGNRRMQVKYRKLREAAYARGWVEYDDLARVPTFRDFVVLYVAEGYKRSRHTASVCNSDPRIVAMTFDWMSRLSDKTPIVRVQYHRDQDVDTLRAFWSSTVGVDPEAIRLQPKTNSAELSKRSWRCVHGVAAIDVYSTELRARIEAWMDRLRESWRLDSNA